MIPMLGRAVARTRGAHAKQFIPLIQKFKPVISANTTRALTAQVLSKPADIKNKIEPKSIPPTKQELLEKLDLCKKTGSVPDAVLTVQKAQDYGLDSPDLYKKMFEIIGASPFDIEHASIVAYWFYGRETKVSTVAKHDLDLWKNVLKMSFNFGNISHKENLRALLNKFPLVFDLNELNDQESWEILIKGYGILGKSENVVHHFESLEKNAKDRISFLQNALIAFAMINHEDKMQEIVQKLKSENGLSRSIVERAAKVYAFQGSVEKTTQYMKLADELDPSDENKTILLLAHKTALKKIVKKLANSRGSRGFKLMPNNTSEIEQLHASWTTLTEGMISRNVLTDITDCNIILEYIAYANRIDPERFPMEKTKEFMDTYMNDHNIKPNKTTYGILLNGYSLTQQRFKNGQADRLDEVLKILPEMRDNGFKTNERLTFHALFRACIPLVGESSLFDYFKSATILPPKQNLKGRLDCRVFDVEKIMLESRIPHDRVTLYTMLKCLAAGNHFDAFRNRWNTFRIHGFSPDAALYRHAFELSSLDATQSRLAIRQWKIDMMTDIEDKRRIDFDLNYAMLNCCITAQLPQEAKTIIEHLQKKKEKAIEKDPTWLDTQGPKFYSELLRASTLIQGLSSNSIIREMKEKKIEYNQSIWEVLLSKYAAESDYKSVRKLFNQYTMSRFEKRGSIPIPVREGSPVIPFPSGPYNRLDVQFINVYLSTLLDTQNISLVFDVLRTWSEQTSELSINRDALFGTIKLAKKEKDLASLEWLAKEVFPKCKDDSKRFRRLEQSVNYYVQNN